MIETCLDHLTPEDIGLPGERFLDYRQIQREIAHYIIYGPNDDGGNRFKGVGAPTGSGKTLATETAVVLSGVKAVTLTATLPLQDQRQADFGNRPDRRFKDIRGRDNYKCSGMRKGFGSAKGPAAKRNLTCKEGDELGCEYVGSTACEYTENVELAKLAISDSTNYQYWMHARAQNPAALSSPGNPVGLLILDECHKAVEELSRFLNKWIGLVELQTYARMDAQDMPWSRTGKHQGREHGKVDETWVAMLQTALREAEAYKAALMIRYQTTIEARRHQDYRDADEFAQKVGMVVRHGGDGNWIWQQEKKGILFRCVWPWRYAERYLFCGIERVALVSATTRPKLFNLLGIKRSEIDFKEWPRQFPAKQSMVYFVPTLGIETIKEGPQKGQRRNVRMSDKMPAQDLDLIFKRVDEVMEIWKGHKGIIHTASYDRAELFQLKCKYGRHMLLNKRNTYGGGALGHTAVDMAEKYKKRVLGPEDMCALVSPSYTTGWDFPLDENEYDSYQIIVKIPFHNQGDPLVQARAESDEDYEVYDIVQTLEQATGRRNRKMSDWCTTIILDGHVRRFLGQQAKKHASSWWRVYESADIPRPRERKRAA